MILNCHFLDSLLLHRPKTRCIGIGIKVAGSKQSWQNFFRHLGHHILGHPPLETNGTQQWGHLLTSFSTVSNVVSFGSFLIVLIEEAVIEISIML